MDQIDGSTDGEMVRIVVAGGGRIINSVIIQYPWIRGVTSDHLFRLCPSVK